MTDTDASKPNDNVIVIPSHVSGLQFLENLLSSFGSYDKYPIIVVVNEYTDDVEPLYQAILRKFDHLPLTLGRVTSNSFEFGGLLHAYEETKYENFFLLPHSCEVVDPRIFDIAFEEYPHRSVAVFLRIIAGRPIWESHIGKYRRETLTALDFKRFQPHNIFEATFKSEFGFTFFYHLREPTAHALYKLFEQLGEVTEKFGKARLKMTTPYLIKWKTHWSPSMLFKSFKSLPHRKKELMYYRGFYMVWFVVGCWIVAGTYSHEWIRESISALRGGALWSPRYYRWRRQLKKHPELRRDSGFFTGGQLTGGRILRHLGYSDAFVRFWVDGHPTAHPCLYDHVLKPDGLVLDVGAFTGEYAEGLFNRYRCEIHCFEPMPPYCAVLERRFRGNPRVHIHEIGLSDRTYETKMSIKGPGSSEFGLALAKRPVQMKDVTEVFAALDRDVDLLKVNIEGGEYPLLKRMLQADLLRRCKKIMVQFHGIPRSARLVRRLRLELIAGIERTHNPTFSYPFVWEGWERKP